MDESVERAILRDLENKQTELISLRRDLHAHPELAYQEVRTAAVVAERLRAAGLEVTQGVAGTGVVALLRGGSAGHTVLVRADIDALPIQEQSEVPFRSTNAGVMHACGHDGHTAITAVVGEALAPHAARLPGNVKLVFQPAEESIGGAQRMIEAGVMENPPVEFALGLHLWNDLPVGAIGVSAGPTFASADGFTLVITGRGGHGAMPHQAVDAIAIAGQFLGAIHTLVSREVSPFRPAVVTVGTIHGGTAFNIIADTVRMEGTLRTFDEVLRQRLIERLASLAAGVAGGMRGEARLEITQSCPAVVNDPRICRVVQQAAEATVGAASVRELLPSTGADDVALFLQRVPGCYFAVGSSNRARGIGKPHHHPQFEIDEDALPIGAAVLARSILRLLPPGQ